MMITISKEEFEKYVLAATSARCETYDQVSKQFESEYNYHVSYCLGNDTFLGKESVTEAFKRVVSIAAFLHSIPSLDLVITPTGFGVVSTQEVAPASRERVNALQEQLSLEYRRCIGKLIDCLRGSDWGITDVAKLRIPTLLYSVDLCNEYGLKYKSDDEYHTSLVNAAATDLLLRDVISDEYMEELLNDIRCDGGKADVSIIHRLRMLLVFAQTNNEKAYSQGIRQLINHLENNLDKYTTYAASTAHNNNTYVGFQNTKDSKAFVFVG